MRIRIKTAAPPARHFACAIGLAVLLGILAPGTPYADELPRPRPVPEAAAIKEAETGLRQAYKNEFAKKAPSDKQVLASKLVVLAAEQADYPEKYFAMLSLARELSADAGELATSFEAIATLDRTFAIDPIKLKLDSIARVVKNPKLREHDSNTAVQTLAVAEEAVQRFDYDAATRLIGMAGSIAKRTKHDLLQDVAAARLKELVAARTRFDRARAASTQLLEDSDNPNSKTILGEFWCGVAGAWEKGLALLSDCDNATLRDLARKELAQPTGAADQVALGNGWLQAADAYQSPLKSRFQRRARTWFLKAWPQLTGPVQADVEKKISRVPSRPAVLAIHAEIDGVDEIVVTESSAELVHREWEMPATIQFNGDVNWSPRTSRILPNAGTTQFLPDGVSFAKASVVKLQGRGEVRLIPALDRITVEFRDGEVGADVYDVLVLFSE